MLLRAVVCLVLLCFWNGHARRQESELLHRPGAFLVVHVPGLSNTGMLSYQALLTIIRIHLLSILCTAVFTYFVRLLSVMNVERKHSYLHGSYFERRKGGGSKGWRSTSSISRNFYHAVLEKESQWSDWQGNRQPWMMCENEEALGKAAEDIMCVYRVWKIRQSVFSQI